MRNLASCIPALLAGCALAVATAGGAEAASLTVKPGKWEVVTTEKSPLSPKPKSRTSIECVRDESFDPVSELSANASCKIQDRVLDGTTLRWKIECPGPTSPMVGEGVFTSDGDRATGSVDMRMDLNGTPVKFSQQWEGKHLGPCDDAP